ncbi:MAG: DUF4331 domain-containing protein [Acidimicrobiales bacterium]
MSSHREAPGISKDPVADSTDLYAFVSPDRSDHVTLIANYIPLEEPAGGPNFYEFGDDVLYEIHINNSGGGTPDISYQFQFTTEVGDPSTFLYNTGPITSIGSPNWNRKQFYNVTRVDKNGTTTLGTHLPCPPCNVGTHSIPNIHQLGAEAVRTLSTGEKVYAGQRAEAFYVDLGSIFDLGDLRPFQSYFLIPSSPQPGVNALAGKNVHSIAIQVPISMLTNDGSRPSNVQAANATIGVWTTASRQMSTILPNTMTGPYVQVSRLGNPLINEVIIPMGEKDTWNQSYPANDSNFANFYAHPGLAELLPTLYPKAFPNLKKLNASGAARADLEAILLTGIPAGIVPGFQNYTGATQSDLLRLNVAVPPASKPSLLGLLGGDAAGFPNGRRPMDDITSIELRALAGVTYALVDKSYKPDAAAGLLYDVDDPAKLTEATLWKIGVSLQAHFPYLTPGWNGFEHPAKTTF